MKVIYALTDYKNNFGSKWKDYPYRSGFDKSILESQFNKNGISVKFIKFKDINFHNQKWSNKIFIYTSSEEHGLYYKGFIEDIVLSLSNAGAIVIPSFQFLRANNNKVFMELLMEQVLGIENTGKKSKVYGTFEELSNDINNNRIKFPIVIKSADGSMSKGVQLANNKKDVKKIIKKLAYTSNFYHEIKESIRQKKYPGYKRESKFQKKFIVQPFLSGFKNDWKILIYGDHYYILNRGIKKNDFRASGSHYNYRAGSKSGFPLNILDKVEEIYMKLDVPHLSIDWAYNGERSFIHEIQAVHFGSSTLYYSDDYYIKKNGNWLSEKKQFENEEEEYVAGLIKYFNRHPEFFEK